MASIWQVVYYTFQEENPVSDFLDSLSLGQQGKLLRIFHNIREHGLDSVIPHLKKLEGTPFWEIRILGKDNLRVIYIVPTQFYVLLLHGFNKKKQKTPTRELKKARNRFTEWKLSQELTG